MLESAKFIENASQGPDITLVVIGLALADLRAQIVGRAHGGLCQLHRSLQHLQIIAQAILERSFVGARLDLP